MAIDKNVKGIKIEIGAETVGFEKGLKSVNAESKRTQTELEQVNRLLKLDPTNTELLTQKQKLLAQGIEQTQIKVDALKKAKDEADKNMQNGTQINEQQYRKLQREIAASEMSVKNLEKQNENFGKTSHLASITASNGFQKVDKISGTVLKSIGALTVAVGGISVKAAYAADDINTMAKVTGLTTDEIQKFQYASERIDVSLDTLTGSMSKLTKNMATASKGTGDAYKAFKDLNIEFKNQDGTLRNKKDVFNDVIDALGKMENETQRDAYAMQLMGKSAQELNPLILGGSKDLEKYGKEAEKAGLILSTDTLNGANELADSLDKLKATATSSMTKVGAEFAKSIKPIVDKLPEATDFIIRNKDAIGKTVIVVGSFAAVTKTATTSMKLFNAVSKANPYVVLATAISGVAIAIGAATIANDKANDRFKKQKNVLKENKDYVDDVTQSWKEAEKASKDYAEKGIVEISQTEALWGELKNLVDVNGKVSQGNEDKVKFLVEKLNPALDNELKLVNGQVQGYKDAAAEFEHLMTIKKAQTWLDANKSKVEEATSKVDVEDKKISEMTAQLEKYNDEYLKAYERQQKFKGEEYNAYLLGESDVPDTYKQNKDNSYHYATNTGYMTASKDLETYQKLINGTKGELSKLETQYKNHYKTLDQTRQLEYAISKKDYKAMTTLITQFNTDFKTSSNASISELQTQLETNYSTWQRQYQNLLAGMPGMTKEKVNETFTLLVNSAESLTMAGGTIPESIAKGINDKATTVQKAAFNAVNINLSGQGEKVAQSFAKGFNNGIGKSLSLLLSGGKGPVNTNINIADSINKRLGAIPKFAKGGELRDGMGIVAEAGPELIQMINGRAVMTPLTNKSSGKAIGNNVTIQLIGTGVTVQQVESIVKRNMGGAYN